MKHAITAFATMSRFQNNIIDNKDSQGSTGIWINMIHPDQIPFLDITHNVIRTNDPNGINFTDQISYYCPVDYYNVKDELETKFAHDIIEGKSNKI